MKKTMRKIKFPLAMKLIVIISVVIVLSTLAITFLASSLFATNLRNNAEVSNLTRTENFAFQLKSEFEHITDDARAVMLLALEKSGFLASNPSFSQDYFKYHKKIAYIGVPNVIELWNSQFFIENQITPESAQDFLKDNASTLTEKVQGAKIINASPWFEASVMAIVANFSGKSAESQNIVIIFSAESVQKLFDSDPTALSYAVTWNGDVLYHPDYSVYNSSVNLQQSPLIKDLMQSAQATKQIQFTTADNEEFFGAFTKETFGYFAVVSELPVSVVYSAVYYAVMLDLILTGIVLLISILIIWFVARSTTAPILRLVQAADDVSAGKFILDIRPTTHDEVGLLTDTFVQMGEGLAERERIKETFGKFVNKDIAEKAMRGELSLGGEKRDATVMFSDIRSFTAISESLTPEAVVEFLNHYMTRMVDCIEQTGGVVDKFIGDAIMAIWGAPVSQGSVTEDALQSIKALLLMRESLIEFNKDRGGPGKPIIKIGCGLNTGSCVAGQIGSLKRMEYTVIGDAVNTASRIEALNKPFGTDILISENTYKLVKDHIIVEKMPPIKVKGKAEPLNIYAVVNFKNASSGPKTLAEVRALLDIEPPATIATPEQEEKKYEIL